MDERYDTFDAFVMQYDMNEEMIGYKYNHSYRVVHQAQEIARSLKLSDEDKEIAEIVALLHDVARFKQWTEYKTFDDHKSFDHGDEAIKILFEDGEIEKYNVDKKFYDIIKIAIKNHNKLKYDEESLSAKEKLHCKIIRDADKIDIIYAFSTHRLLEMESDDSEINPKVIEKITQHKLVNKEDAETKNDRILMELALAYDLNYKYSIERVYNEGYLSKMVESLEHKEIFKPYVDEINKYMKGEIENAGQEIQS